MSRDLRSPEAKIRHWFNNQRQKSARKERAAASFIIMLQTQILFSSRGFFSI
jgi:hypothetical protein